MRNKRKHLKQTSTLKRTFALLLSMLITLGTTISVFAFAIMPTNESTETSNDISATSINSIPTTTYPTATTKTEITKEKTTKDINNNKNKNKNKDKSSTNKKSQTETKIKTKTNLITPTSNDKTKKDNDKTKYKKESKKDYETTSTNKSFSGKHLIEINNPNYSYSPKQIHLSKSDRELAARVIMGEYGNGGYVACCLIAQSMRDGMIKSNYSSISEIVTQYQYSGYNDFPNKDCYDAIDYIFESGGLAVPHRILYMYSTSLTYSSWHESQKFIVQHGVVRFFDAW